MSIRQEPGCLVVAGEIDLSNVEALRRALESADPGSRLLVDVSGVEYIDSAGIAALFARAREGGLEIVHAGNPVVVSLVRITGLDEVATVRA